MIRGHGEGDPVSGFDLDADTGASAAEAEIGRHDLGDRVLHVVNVTRGIYVCVKVDILSKRHKAGFSFPTFQHVDGDRLVVFQPCVVPDDARVRAGVLLGRVLEGKLVVVVAGLVLAVELVDLLTRKVLPLHDICE